ncbi:2-amino-4-hydroxy-6-hydroxymethyldihydropteridine diphosphokinase [bacterium]|nr:2-amino-4-hydroxy-6-hydroxymethyldihydropteridine diphosphokinase [bacterium]
MARYILSPIKLKQTRFHIAFGSNLGNRIELLQSAVNALQQEEGIVLERISSVYESPALVMEGSPAQPDYLNAVAFGSTTLLPADLLDVFLAIEARFGRNRAAEGRWQARTLDLDLLNWGTETIETPKLTLPHPRIASRRFVLDPLAEIDPNLKLPSPYNCTVEYLHAHCHDSARTTLSRFVLTIPISG